VVKFDNKSVWAYNKYKSQKGNQMSESCVKYAVKYPCPPQFAQNFFNGKKPDLWVCASIIKTVDTVKFENAILSSSLAKAQAKAKELGGQVYAISVSVSSVI
jgi:hypothetical protein